MKKQSTFLVHKGHKTMLFSIDAYCPKCHALAARRHPARAIRDVWKLQGCGV